MSETMTIGEASAATGLSPDALRYYEAESIVGPIARDSSHRRIYAARDIAWIGVVTCMRDAGLGIADLKTFAALLRGGQATESEAPADPSIFLQERRAALAARADALNRAIAVLDDKIIHFARRDAPSGDASTAA